MAEVEKVEQETTKKGGKLFSIFSWTAIGLLTVLLCFFIYANFFCIKIDVEGGSMLPTLSSGDEVIARKNREAKVGDVVIISGEREDAFIIKRVIAVGGQTVKIEDGYVFVDGVKIDEPYLDSQGQTKAHLWQERTLKEDEIFFLGDNRLNSEDSRGKYGTCKESQIAGVVPNWVISLKGMIKIFI